MKRITCNIGVVGREGRLVDGLVFGQRSNHLWLEGDITSFGFVADTQRITIVQNAIAGFAGIGLGLIIKNSNDHVQVTIANFRAVVKTKEPVVIEGVGWNCFGSA